MRYLLTLFLALSTLTLSAASPQRMRRLSDSQSSNSWKIGIATTAAPETVSVYLTLPNILHVSWGDGSSEDCTATGLYSHSYSVSGNYTVSFSGQARAISWYSGYGATPLVVRSIKNAVKGVNGLTSFANAFRGCTNLVWVLDSRIFVSCPLVTSFAYAFHTCPGISGTITDGLFSSNPLTTTLEYAFYSCNGIDGDIPAALFANCPEITSLDYTFYRTSGNSRASPSLTPLTKLITVGFQSSKMNNYTASVLSTNITSFRMDVNNLPASAVNQILADFVANITAGKPLPTGVTLNLGGAGNAAPTGQGLLDKATLAGAPWNWVVTTN